MRALLIRQLLHLTDEQMAFHLPDRLNFQHFFGLRHSSPIPERSTPAQT
jgi:IS5 family transposase